MNDSKLSKPLGRTLRRKQIGSFVFVHHYRHRWPHSIAAMGLIWREESPANLLSDKGIRFRGVGAQLQVPLRLTIAFLMLDIGREWTLNASLTRLSSYRKCSKRRILGHSAQATSRLRIEDTTKCSRIARGFGFGSGMASVAEWSLQWFNWARWTNPRCEWT